MSSIWSSGAAQASTSPFSTSGTAPVPGGTAAGKFQSLLQAAGQSSQSAALTLGQSSGSTSSASQLGVSTATSSAANTNDSSTSSATISANDFLSLLVTEMQNQDPTAQTDPNAYIDQLVQINSLEQLISINQNLSTVLSSATTTTPPTSPTSGAIGATGVIAKGSHASGSIPSGSNQGTAWKPTYGNGSERAALHNGVTPAVNGNLSVPTASQASRVVASSLNGHPGEAPRGHTIRDIRTRALP